MSTCATVYVPNAFALADPAGCHDVIEKNPFAELITVIDGTPFVSHLPILLDRRRGALGTLVGHMARPNPQWRTLCEQRPLVVFRGAHAYVSPRMYATSPHVPTWNYLVVHARGTARLLDEEATLHAVDALARRFEGDAPEAWTMSSVPEAFTRGLVRGIVAFEIEIEGLEGKAKMSQNRAGEDRESVENFLRNSTDQDERAVSDWMSHQRGS